MNALSAPGNLGPVFRPGGEENDEAWAIFCVDNLPVTDRCSPDIPEFPAGGQGDLLPQGAFDADLVAGSRIKDAAAAGNIQDRVGDGVSCTRKRDG